MVTRPNVSQRHAYLITTLGVALVTAIRFSFAPILTDETPLLPYVLAVLAGSWICGLRGGVLATVLSAIVGEALFVYPYESPLAARELLRLGIFVAEGLMISLLVGLLHRERARAETANAEKDEFVGMLAHELRNPLNAVYTALEIMRIRQSDDRRVWARQIIERQAALMKRMVEDLLDVSRIRRDVFEDLVHVPTSVFSVVSAAVAGAKPAFAERSQELDVLLPTVDAEVVGDMGRLQQALSNLLANASRYTPDGGRIRLTVAFDAKTVEISVRDTGQGFPAGDLSRLFKPFQRGANSTGLGIGLFLTRTFVERHGGRVTANSPGPGLGSTFLITLPLFRIVDDGDGHDGQLIQDMTA